MRRTDNGWWIADTDDGRDPQLFNAEQIEGARAQIERALPFVTEPRSRVVIQGGARCGLWPILLADYFAEVHTFEPDPENYRCLTANADYQLAERRPMLHAYARALGPRTGRNMLRHSWESNGLHHLVPSPTDYSDCTEVDVIRIDVIGTDEPVGAIFLDVEGYEIEALRGALGTLEHDRPVIVAEENSLIERYGRARGDLERFLQPLGYRLVAEFYTLPDAEQHDGQFRGSDLIFAAA